jgi:hypothetical protein
MNDFTPVITVTTNQASLGMAFAQGRKTKKHSKDQLTDVKWNLSRFFFHGTSLGSLFVVHAGYSLNLP